MKAAALFTAGFSEAGTDEGREREARLLAAARRGARPVRLVGPNCMALYVPKTGLAMLPNMPSEVGPVAFVSQSGSLCTFVAGGGYARGLAFSKVVSIGNQADLTAADFFEYLADDPETEVIASYLEGARDGRHLFRALERCASRKPVVIWKAGRTEAGARAAHSHTAALSGERAVWSAMLRQVGALPAHDMDEMLDLLVACRHVPRGRRSASRDTGGTGRAGGIGVGRVRGERAGAAATVGGHAGGAAGHHPDGRHERAQPDRHGAGDARRGGDVLSGDGGGGVRPERGRDPGDRRVGRLAVAGVVCGGAGGDCAADGEADHAVVGGRREPVGEGVFRSRDRDVRQSGAGAVGVRAGDGARALEPPTGESYDRYLSSLRSPSACCVAGSKGSRHSSARCSCSIRELSASGNQVNLLSIH